MAAGKYNILIQQGADYIQQLTIKQPDGTAVNLTGCTFRGQVRLDFDDVAPVASFVCSAVDLVNGKFKIALSNTVTAALSFNTAVYDVEIVYPSGVVDRIIQGKAVLSKEATK